MCTESRKSDIEVEKGGWRWWRKTRRLLELCLRRKVSRVLSLPL